MGILEKLGLGWFREVSKENRLILVSNRLPVTVGIGENGPSYTPSSGGLATGLGSIYKKYQSLWIGWPGLEAENTGLFKSEIDKVLLDRFSAIPVWLRHNEVEGYYHGFSNRTIWPLFHYFPKLTSYDKRQWEAYVEVNRRFAEAVERVYRPGDIIWIHDYQLMLVPAMIRERIPSAEIGFFLHIPFPTFEVFRLLPWRDAVLRGLLGADLVGFHTYDYTMYFLRSVRRILGHESHLFQISLPSRVVRVDTFPIGIDFEKYSMAVEEKDVLDEAAAFRAGLEGARVMLSVDRLDYTKGIPQRLEALDLFFTRHPQWMGKVVNVVVAAPSRGDVDQYQLLKKEVDELVGKVNGKHGRIGWNPVQYLYRTMPFASMAALYHVADIALITPLRDGMNLVAKEYVAAKNGLDGVLILSEMTGASMELSEALIVNPNDVEGMAAAIAQALEMPQEEKSARMKAMRGRVSRYNAAVWGEDFLSRLAATRETQRALAIHIPGRAEMEKMKQAYNEAKNRIILLDYDGTLAPFHKDPVKARPTEEVKALIKTMAMFENTHVAIISGRSGAFLEECFGESCAILAAEHGASVKRDGGWSGLAHASAEWKGEIRPILDFFADRTPGAFVEEKELSLVWHYRKADLEFGAARANELQDNLKALLANLDLQAQEGNKCIDIRNASINKGAAAKRLIGEGEFGFVMAIGDDWTDEDMFRALPEGAFSIRVGLVPTSAKYSLEGPGEVLAFLKEFTKALLT